MFHVLESLMFRERAEPERSPRLFQICAALALLVWQLEFHFRVAFRNYELALYYFLLTYHNGCTISRVA